MTDSTASAAADSPARSSSASARLDDNDLPWPLRPWIMAAICALAGLAIHMFVDRQYVAEPAPLLDALAAFVAIGTTVFVLGRAAPLALGAGVRAALGRGDGTDYLAFGGV